MTPKTDKWVQLFTPVIISLVISLLVMMGYAAGKAELKALDADVGEVATQMDTTTARVDTVEVDVNTLQGQVADAVIEARSAVVTVEAYRAESQGGDYVERSELGKYAELEAVAEALNRMETTMARIMNLDVVDLETLVSELEGRVGELEKEIE